MHHAQVAFSALFLHFFFCISTSVLYFYTEEDLMHFYLWG